MKTQELEAFISVITEQVKIQYGVNIEINVCNVSAEKDPLMDLPPALRRKLKNRKAFRRAVKVGLISFEHGHWISHFPSIRMLTYFLGRCYCSDIVTGRRIHQRKGKGKGKGKGKCKFPASAWERLFGVKGLYNARKKVLKNKIPEYYQLYDFLFDMRPLGGATGGAEVGKLPQNGDINSRERIENVKSKTLKK